MPFRVELRDEASDPVPLPEVGEQGSRRHGKIARLSSPTNISITRGVRDDAIPEVICLSSKIGGVDDLKRRIKLHYKGVHSSARLALKGIGYLEVGRVEVAREINESHGVDGDSHGFIIVAAAERCGF